MSTCAIGCAVVCSELVLRSIKRLCFPSLHLPHRGSGTVAEAIVVHTLPPRASARAVVRDPLPDRHLPVRGCHRGNRACELAAGVQNASSLRVPRSISASICVGTVLLAGCRIACVLCCARLAASGQLFRLVASQPGGFHSVDDLVSIRINDYTAPTPSAIAPEGLQRRARC